MTPQDLIDDLRSRINTAYAEQVGTESWERRLCVEALEAQADEIERLRAEIDEIKQVEFPLKVRKVADGWRGKVEALKAEIERQKARYALLEESYSLLRTELDEMRKQEPVGTAFLCDRCKTPLDGEIRCPACNHYTATEEHVYLAPGAQPAPNA